MIKIIVGNISERTEVIKDPTSVTPRQVLEEQGIDYSLGQTALDGNFLKPGDMDRKFSDLGIADKCFLLVSAKHENAAKVLCLGNAVVVRSDVPLAVIKEIERYRPELLTITDCVGGKDVPSFGICATNDPKGSLSEFGAAFSSAGSTNGEGVITLDIPAGVTDRAEHIKATWGKALIKLRELERSISTDYERTVKGDIEAVGNMIEVL